MEYRVVRETLFGGTIQYRIQYRQAGAISWNNNTGTFTGIDEARKRFINLRSKEVKFLEEVIPPDADYSKDA